MTEAKRPSWVLTLLKAQIRTVDAEAMGKSPWTLFCITIVITALLAAYPFVADKQKTSIESANPGLYPGISSVFQSIAEANWDIKVENGVLVTGAGVPAETRFGNWHVVVEPSGGSAEVLSAAVGSNSGTTNQKVVFFGKTHFGIVDQSTNKQLDGTYDLLGWFSPDSLKKMAAQKLTVQFLFMAATATLPQVQASVSMLMFVQIVFLVFLLGFLLSLSKVQVRGLQVNRLRAAGFTSSLKTAGAVALGPALLVAVVLSPLSGAGSISWVLYTLLFGARIIVIYMARFRNKKKPAGD